MMYKSSIAKTVQFENRQRGEDFKWAAKIKHLIRKEGRIEKVLYYYNFDMGKSETQ